MVMVIKIPFLVISRFRIYHMDCKINRIFLAVQNTRKIGTIFTFLVILVGKEGKNKIPCLKLVDFCKMEGASFRYFKEIT